MVSSHTTLSSHDCRYNYPNFLNLFSTFMHIPICFAYIIPKFGMEKLDLPQRPFWIMGALDCLATSMQIFSSVYLPGPLLVLLPQAAIPFSIVLSRYLLKERYHWSQYVGASVVIAGILVVLEPIISGSRSPDYYCEAIHEAEACTICQVEQTQENCLSHRGDSGLFGEDDALCQWLPSDQATREREFLTFVWSFVMIASCIPMSLSTIYKEVALGSETQLHPIVLNGWISIYQLFFSALLVIPAGMVSAPVVDPWDVPRNLWHGLLCYTGHGSVKTGCHPDRYCSPHAILFVNLYLVANFGYTFSMTYILKYGSTALLFLALTVMVPRTWHMIDLVRVRRVSHFPQLAISRSPSRSCRATA